MNPNASMSIVAAIGAAILAAVISCSPAATPTGSGTTTVAPSGSGSAQPAATSSTEPNAPAPPTTATATAPKPVAATITPEGDTTVRLGGPPMRFTVTLVNNGPDLPRVGLVVSLGHCSCGQPGASMMAEGTMRMLDTQTNAWVDVPFVREGTGMDYITVNLVPPFPMRHGQTITYQLEMALDAEQKAEITDGETSIGVTLTDPDNPMEGDPLGSGSFYPVTVQT